MKGCLSYPSERTSSPMNIDENPLLHWVTSTFSSPIKPSRLTFFDLIMILVISLGVHCLGKFFSYVYRQFCVLFIDELSMDLTSDDVHTKPSGVFANGWIPVTETEKLDVGKIVKVRVLDRDIVLMRDSGGKVHAMDPYCPHNGAHLGFGNVVRIRGEDCVQCPFHEWSFRADDGVCIDVPYAKDRKSPRGINLKKWPCTEVNNFIHIWFHNGGKEPDWHPEALEGFDSGEITFCGHFNYVFNCNPYDIIENSSDHYHFISVHLKPTTLARITEGFPFYNKPEKTLNKFTWNAYKAPQSHKAESRIEFVFRLKNKMILKNCLKIIFHGPFTNHIYSEMTFLGLTSRTKLVTAFIPRSSNKVNAVSRFYCGKSFLSRLIGRLHLVFFFFNAYEDGQIWQTKTHFERPIYLKEEKEMAACKRWYSKFYDGADRLLSDTKSN